MAQPLTQPRRIFAVASGILLVAISLVGPASASNMAFKFNASITGRGTGAFGYNVLSLPDVNPYLGSGGLTALCTALGLTGGNGQLVQFDAQIGQINTFTCGQVETFSLTPGVAVIVFNDVNAGGVVVGADTPGNAYDIFQLGTRPLGQNYFPVEYHTTAVTPEDLCQQCGLSGTATVTYFDAAVGNVFTHTCGQVPVFNLVLGAGVLIQEPAGDVSCTPSHF